jgi:alpha-beta hydrolase superfamily lysophospholipase
MHTQEYAPGRAVDLFGDPCHPRVLLWHGMQTDARDAVRPLAEQLASHDLSVLTPDWNSHAADGGRSDLLGSVEFARHHAGGSTPLALIGWSLGGVAAAGIAISAEQFDVPLVHTVCLAGAFTARDPISGHTVADLLTPSRVGAPFTLLHGERDDVVSIDASRTFAAGLRRVGWPVELVELDTDHGAIAGAKYDVGNDRYLAASDPQTVEVVCDVAARIAAILGRP